MKKETPSFNEFFESIQADKADDRERLIEQLKKGLNNCSEFLSSKTVRPELVEG
ncbi:hypothetical protein MNBD_GAMMA24-1076 [hydrothermal vent metagenome]|uniref:Uncharacterized protein n=1 Tax=hydrothermal vent metagenome TaxID=652676 RepID=A0A3B1BCC4_9ZZZZ